jgi:hypothetical protein
MEFSKVIYDISDEIENGANLILGQWLRVSPSDLNGDTDLDLLALAIRREVARLGFDSQLEHHHAYGGYYTYRICPNGLSFVADYPGFIRSEAEAVIRSWHRYVTEYVPRMKATEVTSAPV